MTVPLRVLLVEDSAIDAKLVVRELRKAGFEPREERVDTAEALDRALGVRPFEIVLCDWSMPLLDATEAIRIVRSHDADVPILILSGTIGEETAVTAMRLGAQDYILKDNLKRLGHAVERELADAANRRERRRLEAELEHARRIDAIGRLAGGLAHDFRNLLSVILGYADLLRAQVPPGHPMRADLDEVRQAANRGVDLSRQLLAFSRKEATTRTAFEPNAVIRGFEKMMRTLIGEDIEVVLALDAAAGVVEWDPLSLEQALLNLAINARDAMPKGGRLTVSSANVDLEEGSEGRPPALAPGAYVAIAVGDTGAGMDAATRAHLFEPFFTTKGPGEGTGLGLAAVHGRVRQAGGDIHVESAPGKGTTFRIYLPRVSEAAAAPASAPTAALPRGQGETVLVAEDDAAVRAVVGRTLEGAGYRVVLARGAQEALAIEAARLESVALLMTDVVMPGTRGTELAEALSARRPGLKVLFVSGYLDGVDVARLTDRPGAGFLEKPFTPEALIRRVRDLLSGA